jgi:hypothetical protein
LGATRAASFLQRGLTSANSFGFLLFAVVHSARAFRMINNDFTTEPLAPSSGAVEFLDTDGMRAVFGVKRSLAYALLSAGLIRGVSLRRPGKLRGKRLFDAQSVRAYLQSCADGEGR